MATGSQFQSISTLCTGTPTTLFPEQSVREIRPHQKCSEKPSKEQPYSRRLGEIIRIPHVIIRMVPLRLRVHVAK